MVVRLFDDALLVDMAGNSWCVCWATLSGPLAHSRRPVHSGFS